MDGAWLSPKRCRACSAGQASRLPLRGSLQLSQSFCCLIQRLIPLAEREPHLPCAISRIVVETRSWHCRHANRLHQMTRKLDIVVESKRTDIGHDVIRSARTEAAETSVRESRHQAVAPRAISLSKILVIAARQPERNGSSFLQRGGRAYGKKIVDFPNGVGDRRRSHGPSHAPSGHGVSLRHAIDGDGALAHSIQSRDRDVLRAVVKNVLVD